MAYCASCGNPVPAVSYAPCPRCGNPTNGAPPRPRGTNVAAIVIGVVVGLFVLVAVIGILAAIAIPNMLTAMQRSRQKRTAADLRTVATAVEAYAGEHDDRYPPGRTADDLVSVLTPTYIRQLPRVDGWGTTIRYECWPAGECTSYAVSSAGADQVFQHESAQEYGGEPRTTHFDCDLVYVNGEFVQFPELGSSPRRNSE